MQFSSVAQSCPTLCDPMNRSTPGLSVHHQFLEFTQTHVNRVSNNIQPFYPLIPFCSCLQCLPASESFPMSQLFTWDGQSIEISALASVLPKNTQDWSPLEWTVESPCRPRDSQESSPTPQFKASILRCSAFFTVELSHPYMTTGKTMDLCWQSNISAFQYAI